MCLFSRLGSYPGIIFLILNFIKISNSLVSDRLSDTESEFCKFALNNGEVIDLSALVNSNQSMTVSTNTSLYIYHPCRDIPLDTVSVNDCQKSYGLCYFLANNSSNKLVDLKEAVQGKIQGSFTLLARNNEAVFRENSMKQPEIVYKHTKNDSVIYSTYIRLECNKNIDNYKIMIDKSLELEHVLTLSSKHICLQTEHYMSGGTVFFIILIVFILLYFIGGILILKFIRGATGIEMIPNHEFWCSLPQLAKDGFKYLTTCGKSTPDSYEKI